MKKLIQILVVVGIVAMFAATVNAAGGARYDSIYNDVFLRNHITGGTNRVFSTVTNYVNNLTNRPTRLIFDGGSWNMNTNWTFSTNQAVYIASGSYWDVKTNCLITFADTPLHWQGPWLLFTGDGATTGLCEFVWEYDEWNSGGDFYIGTGKLDSASFVTLSNLSENMTNNTYGYPALDIADFNDVTIDVTDGARFLKPAMTNTTYGWEFLDTDYRDDVNEDAAGSNWVLGVLSNNAIGSTAGYIEGLWPHYVNTNTVYIEPGEGYCNGKYFALTGSNNYSITSTLTVAGDVVYWYVDDDSAFPTPTIYYATNEPSPSTLLFGYYDLVTLDRCIAATLMDDAAPATLRVFNNAFGTYTWLYDSFFNLGINMATNDPNVWAATTWPLSDTIPVMAESAWLSLQAEDEGGGALSTPDLVPLFEMGLNSANRTPAGTSGNIARLENAQLGLAATIQGGLSGWIYLDRSRNVTWKGNMTPTATIPTNKVYAQGFTLDR